MAFYVLMKGKQSQCVSNTQLVQSAFTQCTLILTFLLIKTHNHSVHGLAWPLFNPAGSKPVFVLLKLVSASHSLSDISIMQFIALQSHKGICVSCKNWWDLPEYIFLSQKSIPLSLQLWPVCVFFNAKRVWLLFE